MPTPGKPANLLSLEGKSHRTKAELNARTNAEQALKSGEKIKAWASVRASPSALKEFRRIVKLLEKIGENDALYQGVINRYSLLKAECDDFECKREKFYNLIYELEESTDKAERTLEYYKTLGQMQNNIVALDKQVMAKRKMMLDIEKENVMTIAAALRVVPKTIENNSNINDPMKNLLQRGRG